MATQGRNVKVKPTTPAGGGVRLQVDDLDFSLRRSARRRTMQITVERNGELILAAPPSVGLVTLRRFIMEKRFWIYTKLAEKDRLQRVVPNKEFVDGEGFLYLGRSYRLKLVDTQEVPLKLSAGRFRLRRDAIPQARDHFVGWYGAHARAWLTARLPEWEARMQVCAAGVTVQDLGYRWGSCGKAGRLYFHWKTILLPARIAEYVAVHELTHLHERHHTPAFWRRMERAMPDYEQRKAWLDMQGGRVEGL